MADHNMHKDMHRPALPPCVGCCSQRRLVIRQMMMHLVSLCSASRPMHHDAPVCIIVGQSLQPSLPSTVSVVWPLGELVPGTPVGFEGCKRRGRHVGMCGSG